MTVMSVPRTDSHLLPAAEIEQARLDLAAAFRWFVRLDMHEAVLRLCEFNGLSLDAYRFDTLDALYQMASRVPIRRAA